MYTPHREHFALNAPCDICGKGQTRLHCSVCGTLVCKKCRAMLGPEIVCRRCCRARGYRTRMGKADGYEIRVVVNVQPAKE